MLLLYVIFYGYNMSDSNDPHGTKPDSRRRGDENDRWGCREGPSNVYRVRIPPNGRKALLQDLKQGGVLESGCNALLVVQLFIH